MSRLGIKSVAMLANPSTEYVLERTHTVHDRDRSKKPSIMIGRVFGCRAHISTRDRDTNMALSVRAKNLIMGGSLGAFAISVFAYTMKQMSVDDFAELDEVAKVNVHQSGTMKATPVKKD